MTRLLVVVQRGRGAVQEVLRLRGAACATRPSTRSRPLTRREAGDVEDLLLGVHRGDLAAELGQRVDDRDPEPAEAGVVGGVQPGGAGADDEQIASSRRGPLAAGSPGAGPRRPRMSRVDARDKGEPQQFWAEFAADPRSPAKRRCAPPTGTATSSTAAGRGLRGRPPRPRGARRAHRAACRRPGRSVSCRRWWPTSSRADARGCPRVGAGGLRVRGRGEGGTPAGRPAGGLRAGHAASPAWSAS